MAIMCKKCTLEVTKDDGVSCKNCSDIYHYTCAGLRATAQRVSKDKRKWKCPECANLNKDSEDTSSIASGGDFETEAPPPSWLKKIEDKLDMLSSLPEIEKSIDFMSKQHDDFTKKQEKQDKIIIDLTRQVKLLTEQLMSKDKEVSDLTVRVNELEQANLCGNIEVHGVEYKREENLPATLNRIALVLGIEGDTTKYVDYAERWNSRKEGEPGVILVRFANLNLRHRWLEAKKKVHLTNGKLFNDDNNQKKIFINEQLTAANKSMLYKTKQRASEKHYKYVWVRGGKILVRREENARILRIRCEADLEKMM